MVSQTSILFMAISAFLSLAVPIGALIYCKKKNISWKPVLIGVLIFILFSQVLEGLLNLFVLKSGSWTDNPYLYALYGGTAAGVFEEVGRLVGFIYLLKKYRKWKDGVAYGIGHGGIEAILIGVIAGIQNISMSTMINSGSFDQVIKAANGDPALLENVREQLISAPSYMFLMGGFERIAAFVLQIALSILVLYAVKNRKAIYLFLAIFIHAAIDFVALLAKELEWSIFVPEGLLLIVAIAAFVFIKRSKRMFDGYSINKDQNTITP
ncbi:YhfC family intramembrane metalloprotease [Fictibacillus aquaticus]|uniref:YhfC family intramembrane metalloprotease n=1 Tax=Fictibacillus aquaticus TaxID=2021314 RepID=A0A235F8L2_9BACL|nr:YhfC family intramembrane metalloprotease [Fictibacillus aquaticus]OYD57650.1 hypothetical protein CGZ90_13375 [Fictibacillus aquaticus]